MRTCRVIPICLSAAIASAAVVTAPALSFAQPAPPLQLTHWLKGEPVPAFEKGKVYLVEFWATWCVPCVANIPKLTQLQNEHSDAGLIVIGVTSFERAGLESCRAFVDAQGKAMAYRVGYDATGEVARLYMDAIGQRGIPYAFVIDRDSRLVWHGLPSNNLDAVVRQTLDGTFNPATYLDPQAKLAELDSKLRHAEATRDLELAASIINEFKALRPELSGRYDADLLLLTYRVKPDRAQVEQLADRLMQGPLWNDAANLGAIAYTFAGAPGASNNAAWETPIAQRAVERALVLTNRSDVQILSFAARVACNTHQHARACALYEEALALATTQQLRGTLQTKLDETRFEQRLHEAATLFVQ